MVKAVWLPTRGCFRRLRKEPAQEKERPRKGEPGQYQRPGDTSSSTLQPSDEGAPACPTDYSQRGHGFANMRQNAARIGGAPEVEGAGPFRGTRVTCMVRFDQVPGDG